MTLLPLACKSLLNRRFAALLTVLTIAVSVTLLLGVEKIRSQARDSFASTISGTDLIVGARSGAVNLLLYSIFHIGDATNNVSWQSYQEISKSPQVAWSVPISLGDSHKGFRVVGTTPEFFTRYHYGAHHELAFDSGKPFDDVYDAVIGAEVAAKLGYTLDQQIVVAHGTGSVSFVEHKDKPFRISGILARTGTPVDASVLISLQAIEAIHIDWQSGARVPGQTISADDAKKTDLTPKTVTAFLLGLKSKVATFGLQRQINDYRAEPLLAILPGIALQELWGLVGTAESALLIVSSLVVIAGLLGMLTALVTTLNERRREMAILRSVGARPRVIFGLLVLEAALLTVLGIVLGIAFLYLVLAFAQGPIETHYGILISLNAPTSRELLLIALVTAGGIFAGIVPATLAYRNSLADGLSLRL